MKNFAQKQGPVKARLYRRIKDRLGATRDREVRVKLELFLLALRVGSVQEACERRGYSRQYFYRWWRRFRRSKMALESLREYSRRPRHSPRKISSRVENRIRWYSRRQYGARMIQALLGREGIYISRSTICHVLRGRRKGLKRSKKELNPHRRRYELVVPGQRVQVDVKYVPELIDGQRAYMYVAIDECTRWRYAHASMSLNEHSTVEFLDGLKRSFPFQIHCIQTDNGREFTFKYLDEQWRTEGRRHAMEVWCERNAVRHRTIPPGAKELNGKVERSHRVDEQYFYWRAPTDSVTTLNERMTAWIRFYNLKRPHGGLGYLTPAEKLEERHITLGKGQDPALTPELETLRLRFLGSMPKRYRAEDHRLVILERELARLLKQAA